jgi:hypothetical protein
MAVNGESRRTEPGLQANWSIEVPPSVKGGGTAIFRCCHERSALSGCDSIA